MALGRLFRPLATRSPGGWPSIRPVCGSDDTRDGGADTLFGGINDDTIVMKRGGANGDVLMDFNGNGAGAMIRLAGCGPGAYLTTPDAAHHAVHTGDGAVADIFTVRSGLPIHASDYYFV